MEKTKICNICGNEKTIDNFGKYRNQCKKCLYELHYTPIKKESLQDGFKKCSKCKEIKPFSEFNKNSASKDGYKYYCRKCTNKPKEELPDGYKRCTKCKDIKSLDEFFNEPRNKTNGKSSACKKCLSKAKPKEILQEGFKRCNNKKCEDPIKVLSEFNKNKRTKDGLSGRCKICKREDDKKHSEKVKNDPEKLDKKRKRLRESMRKKRINMTKEERDEKNKKARDKYWEDPEKGRKQSREWAQNHSEKISIKNKEDRRKNKDKISKRRKELYRENIEENRKKANDRNKNNPHICAWRKLIFHTLDKFGTKKEDHTIDLLKYPAIDLKNHMIHLFTEEMNWEETYGKLKDNTYGWSIDHIIATNNFKPDTPPHIVNELDNLQPLWMTNRIINGVFYQGNFSKCDKILIEEEKSRKLYFKYRKYLKDEVIEEYDNKLLLIDQL